MKYGCILFFLPALLLVGCTNESIPTAATEDAEENEKARLITELASAPANLRDKSVFKAVHKQMTDDIVRCETGSRGLKRLSEVDARCLQLARDIRPMISELLTYEYREPTGMSLEQLRVAVQELHDAEELRKKIAFLADEYLQAQQ